MISAYYYGLIYIIIVIIFSIPVLRRIYNSPIGNIINTTDEPIAKSLFFTVIIILFVGLRPNNPAFMDGGWYWNGILNHSWENTTLEECNYQFAFKWLMSFMSSNNFNPQLGFIIFATITYGAAFLALRKMFPNHTLLAMLLFCGTFGVFGGAVNGIRNGCACSLFLCAIAYKEDIIKCLFFLILSFGFHHALEISIAAFVCCCIYKNTKAYFFVWCTCIILAFLHVTYFQTLFAGFTDEHAADYLITSQDSWVTGFRLDFLLYSAAPVVLGLWIRSKNIYNCHYQFIFNIYLVTNSIWLLCMYASYTNRFAALSWALFPLLILEPLTQELISHNQNRVLFWFVVGQLTFTLLMTIISLPV